MQNPLKIRRATPSDLPLITRFTDLLARFHGDSYICDPAVIMRDVFGPISGARVYFGKHENRAITYAVCTTEIALHRNQRRLHIHLFYVLKAHRRTGVAQQMVTYLQQVAQLEGASALTVSADLQNEAAQQSYLAMGFKRRALTGAYFLKSF